MLLLLSGQLKRGFPVVRREPGIAGVDGAPGEFFRGPLIAVQ
jgi:hypothetical protein